LSRLGYQLEYHLGLVVFGITIEVILIEMDMLFFIFVFAPN